MKYIQQETNQNSVVHRAFTLHLVRKRTKKTCVPQCSDTIYVFVEGKFNATAPAGKAIARQHIRATPVLILADCNRLCKLQVASIMVAASGTGPRPGALGFVPIDHSNIWGSGTSYQT